MPSTCIQSGTQNELLCVPVVAPSNPTQPKTCTQQALMSTIPGLQNASQTAGAPGPYNAHAFCWVIPNGH
jgi:hypothetical protein